AAVFVYPSLYEGFGLPVVEALSCACPVVTGNCSSLPEVGGDAAIYVDPKSIIGITQGIKQAIVQAPKLRQLGLAQAKKFSWDKTAQQTLKIYQEVYDHRS
ncbi:MAG: glycosyltransferase, partial [Patescibacteria group bacterium]